MARSRGALRSPLKTPAIPVEKTPTPVAAAAAFIADLVPTSTSVAAAPSSAATASLAIATRPAGASVSVDGKSVGETPITIKVAPGSHEVSLTRVRYAPISTTVLAPASLEVALKRPDGMLIVESTPSAAAVLIQGEMKGKTPLRLDVAAFRSYDVQVAFAGGDVWHRRVYLKAPSTRVQAKSSKASATVAPGRARAARR
jgi:hypothetical protein